MDWTKYHANTHPRTHTHTHTHPEMEEWARPSSLRSQELVVTTK